MHKREAIFECHTPRKCYTDRSILNWIVNTIVLKLSSFFYDMIRNNLIIIVNKITEMFRIVFTFL